MVQNKVVLHGNINSLCDQKKKKTLAFRSWIGTIVIVSTETKDTYFKMTISFETTLVETVIDLSTTKLLHFCFFGATGSIDHVLLPGKYGTSLSSSNSS